jgi:cytoplasmic iron level regulating protein YaaA (DUF328/UPF0246 family)
MVIRPEEYKPKTNSLFIFICSRNKNDNVDGFDYNLFHEKMTDHLSPNAANYLLKKREDLKKRLIEISWQNRQVSELTMNHQLVEGPDFGGTARTNYLPAISRYTGRFYNENGMGEEGQKNLIKSGHHVLILSGLYGLVTAGEPIQLYSCPLELESIQVLKFWTDADALTSVLIDYIRANRISRIYDLSARKLYRNLIDWEMVRRITPCRVLHCHFNDAAGENALPELGKLFREYLSIRSEEELNFIEPESLISARYGKFIFSESPNPPEKGWAEEPVIGFPELNDSESNKNEILTFLNARVDEFELMMRRFIAKVMTDNKKDYWASFDSFSKRDVEKHVSDYLRKWPMVYPGDINYLNFMDISDYHKIIKQTENWIIFEKIFREREEVKKHFSNIIELRNQLKHNNMPHKSLQKLGEGSIIWFAAIIKRQGLQY